ncbi:hypothetical protein FEM48_Zijuj01G0215300 [Ziziphus jujuba var. spinosa]|uniref:Bulb-type lectin domain-containing protein n=1 Tax=Ziziphus jujuba var. spinosa TaxID=714518 RepID=A0A978W3P0_ZIZJJ|nr:hypothetical protein FEM48_Zijuj01G0215300 [Ziziphus jujuba var. spinosa]
MTVDTTSSTQSIRVNSNLVSNYGKFELGFFNPDTGNVVLRDKKDENSDNYVWQSFDHPTNTLLPVIDSSYYTTSSAATKSTPVVLAGSPSLLQIALLITLTAYSFPLNSAGLTSLLGKLKLMPCYMVTTWLGILTVRNYVHHR